MIYIVLRTCIFVEYMYIHLYMYTHRGGTTTNSFQNRIGSVRLFANTHRCSCIPNCIGVSLLFFFSNFSLSWWILSSLRSREFVRFFFIYYYFRFASNSSFFFSVYFHSSRLAALCAIKKDLFFFSAAVSQMSILARFFCYSLAFWMCHCEQLDSNRAQSEGKKIRTGFTWHDSLSNSKCLISCPHRFERFRI